MDYEKMWERLREEMIHLQVEKVSIIAPAVALGYMDFIEQMQKEEK